jgi:hypothetical protein
MNEETFKKRAAELNFRSDVEEVDELCLDWLRFAASEQTPKVRDMMLAAIDVLRRGLA